MALDENVSALIGRIYESAHDTERWAKVLLDLNALLKTCFILETVADLRHRDLSRSTFYGGGSSLFAEGARVYQEELYLDDPSFEWAARHPLARFCDTSLIMPNDEWSAKEFVRYTRSRMGSSHWLIGYTAPEDELTYGVSIHPPGEVGAVPEHEKALFKMLFEHMERAIRLYARPPLFAGEGEPLILLDRLGRIREMTPAARSIVDSNDGLAAANGELCGADGASTARLNSAVLSSLGALSNGSFGSAVSMPRPTGKRDLLVTVTPLVSPPSPFEAFRPAALVRIVDPELGVAPSAAQRWSEMFGLTPAEVRFAQALVGGDQKLRNAADELGITYHTARVHLRHLLEKTETHSQSQLARLLSRLE